MTEISDLPFTLTALRAAYASGLSPVEVVAEVFDRLARTDDPGIFITLADRKSLEAEAAALERRNRSAPLWGIPLAVKDNIDVAGLSTTVACPAYAYSPEHDAEAVSRLRNAGALIVGKTNLDQFATGLVGTRTPYPIPRNPIDPLLVPGGSSSGSAVAVACGIVALALGTDTAGSGRVPAAFNNIVGLKPSLGAISTRGVVPACRTLDCVSIFAHTVEDAITACAVLAGVDPLDPWSRPIPPMVPVPLRPLLRIGVPKPEDRVFGDETTAAGYAAALKEAARLGAELIPIEFGDFFAVGSLLYGGPWVAERHAAIRGFFEESSGTILPVTREIIGRATKLSAADAFEGLYRLRELARRTESVWTGLDFLLVPSVPGLSTLEDVRTDPFGANARLGTYTNFVNLLDLCALTVPAGERSDGRPNSVTLIGSRGDDGNLAAFGRVLHAATTKTLGATGWPLAPGKWMPPAVGDDRLPVMVFGAHMAGLPLHHELQREGALLDRIARTAPDYRLYAIPGAVARPGLVRVPPGTGVPVEGEIWRLSPAGFGRLVASVAAPLAIGTIHLGDGTTVKGFLAETEGVRGVEDISVHGSWRAHLVARGRAGI